MECDFLNDHTNLFFFQSKAQPSLFCRNCYAALVVFCVVFYIFNTCRCEHMYEVLSFASCSVEILSVFGK